MIRGQVIFFGGGGQMIEGLGHFLGRGQMTEEDIKKLLGANERSPITCVLRIKHESNRDADSEFTEANEIIKEKRKRRRISGRQERIPK